MKFIKPNICYLCGKELDYQKDIIDKDHVPPKQFYAKEIRKIHNPNLFTIPVHRNCNKSYQYDEDYFVNSLAPIAADSYTGLNILLDLKNQYKRPKNRLLKKKIREEFERNLGGLELPNNKILKRFESKRIHKIIWKIFRGLHFNETNEYVPLETKHIWKIVAPNETPPDEFFFISSTPSKGDYPAVFDYKYKIIKNKEIFQLWAFLIWDRIIIIIYFFM